MHFDERDEGEFRIFAGALEAPKGKGYIAAVVIKRIGDAGSPVFRDECLSGGHRWESPKDALQFALSSARKVIRAQSGRAIA